MKHFIALLLSVALLFSFKPTIANESHNQIYNDLMSVVLKMPGPHYPKGKNPETNEQRAKRLQMIVRSTIDESKVAKGTHGEEWIWSRDDLAWAAFVKMWWESGRFSLKVHNGKYRGDGGRSVCLGQIMHGSKKLVGTDPESTRKCVAKVMSILILHQNRCLLKSTPSAWAMSVIYAGYGTGYSCNANTYMIKKDYHGNPLLNKKGEPIKDYWARNRGWMWWQMRNGNHHFQKRKPWYTINP